MEFTGKQPFLSTLAFYSYISLLYLEGQMYIAVYVYFTATDWLEPIPFLIVPFVSFTSCYLLFVVQAICFWPTTWPTTGKIKAETVEQAGWWNNKSGHEKPGWSGKSVVRSLIEYSHAWGHWFESSSLHHKGETIWIFWAERLEFQLFHLFLFRDFKIPRNGYIQAFRTTGRIRTPLFRVIPLV